MPEKVQHFMIVSPIEKMLRDMNDGFLQKFQEDMSGTFTAPETVAAFVKKHLDENFEELIGLVDEVYLKMFTKEELAEIVAFYKSPFGQRMLEVRGTLLDAINETRVAWGNKILEKLGPDLAKYLDNQQEG